VPIHNPPSCLQVQTHQPIAFTPNALTAAGWQACHWQSTLILTFFDLDKSSSSNSDLCKYPSLSFKLGYYWLTWNKGVQTNSIQGNICEGVNIFLCLHSTAKQRDCSSMSDAPHRHYVTGYLVPRGHVCWTGQELTMEKCPGRVTDTRGQLRGINLCCFAQMQAPSSARNGTRKCSKCQAVPEWLALLLSPCSGVI